MKPLKILHLTTHLNVGGISRYLLLLAKAQVERGHAVTVLSSGGELIEDFRHGGVKTAVYPIRAKSELHPKLYRALPKITAWVKQEKFDCLHAHTRVTQVLAFFISRSTGIPVVTTSHGYFKPRFGRRLFGAWGERVIAISPAVGHDLETSHGVAKQKIRIVYNAVDIEELERRLAEKKPQEIKKHFGIPEEAIVISSVSRLVEDKGHSYLIEALKKLKPLYPSIFLFILGDGREREALEKKIKELGLGENAKIVPSLKDASQVYAMTDIFVHPATYREGFGLVLVEAMIAGKPVIATDIPAVNTLVYDGENGFVVPPKDAVALEKKISFVLENPVAARETAERGRAWAKELASKERFCSETTAVYREVVK